MTRAIRVLHSFLLFVFPNGISSLLQTNFFSISRLAVNATGVGLQVRTVRPYNLGTSPCRTTALLSGSNFSRDHHSHPPCILCGGDIASVRERYLDPVPQASRQNDKTPYQKEDIEGPGQYSSTRGEVSQWFQLSTSGYSKRPRSSMFRSRPKNSRRSSSHTLYGEKLFPAKRWNILSLHTHRVYAPAPVNAKVSWGSGLPYMRGGRQQHGEISYRPISSSGSQSIELSIPSEDRSPPGAWSWSTTSKCFGQSFSSRVSLGSRSTSAAGNLRRKDKILQALLSQHRFSFSDSPVPTLFLTPLISSQSAHFAFRTESVALPAALSDRRRSGACCLPTASHTTAVANRTSVSRNGTKPSLTPSLSSLSSGCSAFSCGTSRLFASRPKPKEEKRARNFQRAYMERQKRAAREEKRLMQMQRQLLAQQQEQNEKIKEEQRLRRERATNTGEETTGADGSRKGDGAGTLPSAATVGSRTLTQLMQQSLVLSGEPVKHRENWVIVGSTQRRARRRDQQKFTQQRAFVQSVFSHLSEEQREEEVSKAERSWRGDMMLDELEEELGGPDALAPGGGGV